MVEIIHQDPNDLSTLTMISTMTREEAEEWAIKMGRLIIGYRILS